MPSGLSLKVNSHYPTFDLATLEFKQNRLRFDKLCAHFSEKTNL